MKYVLVTPARNEEAFIRAELDCVTAQTMTPERWVIINDGSTDGTGAIADEYARRFPWIEVVHRARSEQRSFGAKVRAFNAGLERVAGMDYDVIGNLDADITFDADYFEVLMRKFAEDSTLGVAGTPFVEDGYDSARDSFEGERHVAGGVQLFRKKCFEEVGGFVANPAGGVDWIAVTTARMKGWKTRSFGDKRFHHYRPLGTAERGQLAALFSYGEKDYYLGGSPIWEIFRVVYRASKKPVLFGALAILAGYLSAAIRRMKRPVSAELMHFHRGEQLEKLKTIIASRLGVRSPAPVTTRPGNLS
jgi:glycosyltransferase involved in cell wall biosynthesis